MSQFLVTAEGGLTTAGYIVSIVVGIILFIAAAYFAGKSSQKKKMSTKQLVFCALALALSFARSSYWYFGRICLWNYAVFTRTICIVTVPGML